MGGLVLGAGCGDEAEAEEAVPTRHAADFQSDWVQAVMAEADRAIQTRGFTAEGEEWRGFLVDQGTEVNEAPMHAGNCYAVLAAGSDALAELVLRVFDSDGAEVAVDASSGPHAALRYCPAHTGTYYVAALATDGTGLFAIRRYSGPPGLEVRLDDLFPEPPAGEAPAPERP